MEGRLAQATFIFDGHWDARPDRAPQRMPKSASKRTVHESAHQPQATASTHSEKGGGDARERSARAELAALDPALLDEDAWSAARDNLLRFFALLQEFTEAEVDVGETSICPARSGKIARS